MSPTLEPDYHISSDGLPKLNAKKYKIYDKKSYRSKVEDREQVLCANKISHVQENRLFSGGGGDGSGSPAIQHCCDNKKLLSKRTNMDAPINRLNTTNFDYHHRHCARKPPTPILDKELKCAINQKIKLCRNVMNKSRQNDTISTSSNGMLDNRLAATYQQKYFNNIFVDHEETDTLALDF